MLIIPAIDLKKSEVVRLTRGDFDNISYYSKKPAELIRNYILEGASRIHVVLLWGAKTGTVSDVDQEAVKEILSARDSHNKDCIIEIGGGIRRYSQVEELLCGGADMLIIGTALIIPLALESGLSMTDIKIAYQDGGKKFSESEVPEFNLIDRIDKRLRDNIIIAVDYLGEHVSLSGWEVTIPLKPSHIVKRFIERGFRKFILTNIEQDGTMEGVDRVRVSRLLQEINSAGQKPDEIIISGGISSEHDINEIYGMRHRPDGVIIGKALYLNKLDLGEAVKKFQEPDDKKS